MSFHFAHFSANFPANIHLLWHIFLSKTPNQKHPECTFIHLLVLWIRRPWWKHHLYAVLLWTAKHCSTRIFFSVACPIWFRLIKTVVTNFIPFKYLFVCRVFLTPAVSAHYERLATSWPGIRFLRCGVLQEHPRQIRRLSPSPRLCRGRLKKNETCRFMS